MVRIQWIHKYMKRYPARICARPQVIAGAGSSEGGGHLRPDRIQM